MSTLEHAWQNDGKGNFSCSCGMWFVREHDLSTDPDRASNFGYRKWELHMRGATARYDPAMDTLALLALEEHCPKCHSAPGTRCKYGNASVPIHAERVGLVNASVARAAMRRQEYEGRFPDPEPPRPGLTDYERGYRAAQRWAIAWAERADGTEPVSPGYMLTHMKVALSQPIPKEEPDA